MRRRWRFRGKRAAEKRERAARRRVQAHHGACIITMSQGVLVLLSRARSRASHLYCSDAASVAAYEQRATTCAGPTSLDHHRLLTETLWRKGIG